jgi:hypothetical protein
MNFRIEIPQELEGKLREQAAAKGQAPEEYATELVCRGIEGQRTFAEILAPFREEVLGSGDNESQVEALFESAREAVHVDKIRSR